jgi:hypothetical protein
MGGFWKGGGVFSVRVRPASHGRRRIFICRSSRASTSDGFAFTASRSLKSSWFLGLEGRSVVSEHGWMEMREGKGEGRVVR